MASVQRLAMESKTNSDKIVGIATRLLQFQEQFQDSLLELRQTRQMQVDLYERMANMELKQDLIPVQNAPTPLFFLLLRITDHNFSVLHLKWNSLTSMATEPLVVYSRLINF